MTPFKLSTLALALLGGLALTACDRPADTAATDVYESDTTAATEPVETTTPDAAATDPYETTAPTTTMGDAGEMEDSTLGGDSTLEEQDPTYQADPTNQQNEDELDPANPVDESPTPR